MGYRVSIPTPPIPLLAQVLPVLTQVRTLLLSELLPFRPLQVQIPLLPGLLPATFPVPMLPVRPLLAIPLPVLTQGTDTEAARTATDETTASAGTAVDTNAAGTADGETAAGVGVGAETAAGVGL